MTARSKRPKWDSHRIKAAVHRQGMTLVKLAKDAGLHESTCRAALLRPQPQGEQAIAKFLGVSLHELWPDRYDESGGKIRHVRDEDKHDQRISHGLSGRAA